MVRDFLPDSSSSQCSGWSFSKFALSAASYAAEPQIKAEPSAVSNAATASEIVWPTRGSAETACVDRYVNLHSTIEAMADMSEEAPLAIDGRTAGDAKRLIALMSLYDVSPPKIFSHGGDSVVFTWATGKRRLYLTVCDGQATFLERPLNRRFKCVSSFQLDNIEASDFWMKMLGGRQWMARA